MFRRNNDVRFSIAERISITSMLFRQLFQEYKLGHFALSLYIYVYIYNKRLKFQRDSYKLYENNCPNSFTILQLPIFYSLTPLLELAFHIQILLQMCQQMEI